jgi:ribosomal protein L39E
MKWVEKYIGKKWTQEQNCGYWFRLIQKEEFNRNIPVICNTPNTPNRFLLNTVRLMKQVKTNSSCFGWQITNDPISGDAALLAMRTNIHHIGIVVFIDNELQILHAVETCGVILSTLSNLNQNQFNIREYYTYYGS